jgi:hypothetical protein
VYDTQFEFFQFVAADVADYVTLDGRLVIDDPEIREKLVKAMDSYTAIYKKGCPLPVRQPGTIPTTTRPSMPRRSS